MIIRRETLVTLAVSFGIIILLSIGVYYIGTSITPQSSNTNTTTNSNQNVAPGLKRFVSAEDFSQYLTSASRLNTQYGLRDSVLNVVTPTAFELESSGTKSTADRVSQTNVQVMGIDEPDIAKTDGQRIYYSQDTYYGALEYRGISDELLKTSPAYTQTSSILNAIPANALAVAGTLPTSGQLLLTDNEVLVLGYDGVHAYPANTSTVSEATWEMSYGDATSLVTARLREDTLYLVTSTSLNTTQPCPITPLRIAEGDVSIACTDIFHPVNPTPIDVVYTVFAIDPSSGEIKQELTLSGLSGQSVVYVSPETLYLTYTYTSDWVNSFLDILITDTADILPSELIAKLQRLRTYDLSAEARLTELATLLGEYDASISNEEKENFQEQLTTAVEQGVKERLRQWERTGIIAVDLDRLQVAATGEVPGHPLNQFSLDAYAETLRIATSSDARFVASFSATSQTNNDLYILDKDLKPLGSILNLGEAGETIYGVRFVEDTGYLVTFRQTDPFYVLDLSDPKKPIASGELKIPGYSSYLHPIATDRILGVGQDNFRVKVSLFDVSDKNAPKELSTLTLENEYWSDVLNTHHAFLQDADHSIVFIPGSQGGHVISYTNGTLSEVKKIEGFAVQRALYIDNTLYVLGSSEVSAVDETSWETISSVSLNQNRTGVEEPQSTEPSVPIEDLPTTEANTGEGTSATGDSTE
ncbi:MAG: beta-propeller domain-containing protein [Candidatus Nomurabacteria bacterium]|nr:MAG: beta-propeller domain-containing protein [Candidatus Nomurabacteria bacterium]